MLTIGQENFLGLDSMDCVPLAHLAQSGVGNIQPPRALVKDDDDVDDPKRKHYKSRSWFFTLNNPEENDLAHLTQWFDTFTEKYVFQLEVGEKCGTPHFQGVIYFKNAVHENTMKQVAPRGIWKRTISWLGAVEYCKKSETRVEGPWSKGVSFRAPVSVIRELRPWQASEEAKLLGAADDRKVRWVWDAKGGMGKTAFCKYMQVKYDEIVCTLTGNGKDMLHVLAKDLEKKDVKIVIFMFVRSVEERVAYGVIESIKDGFVCSGKFDSQRLVFNSPHVLCISNFAPDRSKLSADRWDVTELWELA